MTAIQRIGDSNSGGGAIVFTAQGKVYANGKLVSIDGSPVSAHGKNVHAGPVTANGSNKVFVNGVPVNASGDADTCGHNRVGGSPNVNVGG
ncbi:MAG: hypothetical protein COA62_15640 [Rhodobiaceae bacterium]|nr:MAG: hypothetical protein COA62_15640 [Rhodobiaceae bacterium]